MKTAFDYEVKKHAGQDVACKPCASEQLTFTASASAAPGPAAFDVATPRVE